MVLIRIYSFLIICLVCNTAISSYAGERICIYEGRRCRVEGFGNDLTVIQLLRVHFKIRTLRINYFEIPIWNAVLLEKWKTLESLNLENNNIESVEANAIHNLPDLISLDLGNNHIKTIPLDTFTQSNHLKKLYFPFNNLTSLESILYVKGPLEVLNLQKNNLTSINGISKLSSLITLKLDRNFISILPESEINKLKLLELLDISSNQITHICKLEGDIKIAIFSNNSILNVNKELFAEAKKLKELSLSENQLAIIEANTFQDLEDLKHLNLNSNQIKQLPLTIFHRQINLEILELSHNKLEFLEYGIFTSLNSLKELHLSYNNFRTLNVNIFYSLKHLQNLHLLGNPLYDLDIEKLLKFNYELSNVYINLTNLDCEKFIQYSAALSEKFVLNAILSQADGINQNCSESAENKQERSSQLEKIENVLRPLLKLHITLTIFAILLLIYLVLLMITCSQKFIQQYNK